MASSMAISWNSSCCVNGSFADDNNLSSSYPEESQSSVTGWFAFTMAVCVFGTVLFLLLLTAAVTKGLHHGAGFLIIHISCLQLYLCAVSYPLSTIDIYLALIPGTREEERLTLHCQSFLFIFKCAVHAEMWSSVLLAVNRCVAVALPYRYKEMTTRAMLCSMVGVPWVIALALNVPLLFGVGMELKRDHPVRYCLAMPNGDSYSAMYLLMERFLPLAVKGVLHFALFLHFGIQRVHRNRVVRLLCVPLKTSLPSRMPRPPQTRNSGSHAHRGGRNMVLAKILGLSFLWKCVCFLPGPISQGIYPNLYSSSKMLQFWMLRTFAVCGYAANPIFFFALSSDYQTALAQLLQHIL
ncbi:hypothetical protein BV898_19628 [Hypsibius exemplaris]|uniref:G-protein coupled receptors family 1 profile domain-containing protein n=1 Tax=Hypsibius exemplaris TaxID=2072580 RepID=A0A9X6NJK5_HYPEX|nr:hypothetical protein BV898_19628 [Hypsibius exemplaris]